MSPILTQNEGENSSTETGLVRVPNLHVHTMAEDVLYHLGLGTLTHDLPAMFGDVKFVCVGGSASRMREFVGILCTKLALAETVQDPITDLCGNNDRYSMYKAGPVLAASHGMGVPSMSILLHELIKLLHHARCRDVTVIRIGTSGGLGLEPGTVVVSRSAVDACFQPQMEQMVLGKSVVRSTELHPGLAAELVACGRAVGGFQTVLGNTMCTHDFYEGQARLDGAVCTYSHEEKLAYLRAAHEAGVCNIEMESSVFSVLCRLSGLQAGVVCVTLLDRLAGDQVSSPHDVLTEFARRPQHLVVELIRTRLSGLEKR
ncbi:uridine phosphorylase 1-like [Lethenteron reissneri]|uniref:uridine phosphorylase 1-like n=1 Tax=Lethenteron reissneri TaxID=7753 RepID=UPI002AB70C62|nr:uridine phosphorylase 1-like [Lethenteron reissneri]XP_061432370.1 uridine phosphorylase 1-like [Lethenteron reissneri]